MERQPKFSLETLPAKTLLHYFKKDQLEKAIPPNVLNQLKGRAQALGKKVTAKFLKDAVLEEPEFIEHLRNSQLGQEAYQKYVTTYLRITSPAVKAKSKEVRAQMVEPRNGFLGCIAAKTDPKIFNECVETYDNPEFQSISLVPRAALKQSVYKKTGNMALAPRPGTHISSLPQGLKSYIRAHPSQYTQYLDELKAQAEYLRTLHHGVQAEQREEGARKKRVVGHGEMVEYDPDEFY